jgi:hypothetical protein
MLVVFEGLPGGCLPRPTSTSSTHTSTTWLAQWCRAGQLRRVHAAHHSSALHAGFEAMVLHYLAASVVVLRVVVLVGIVNHSWPLSQRPPSTPNARASYRSSAVLQR